jgi:hypothetical protein
VRGEGLRTKRKGGAGRVGAWSRVEILAGPGPMDQPGRRGFRDGRSRTRARNLSRRPNFATTAKRTVVAQWLAARDLIPHSKVLTQHRRTARHDCESAWRTVNAGSNPAGATTEIPALSATSLPFRAVGRTPAKGHKGPETDRGSGSGMAASFGGVMGPLSAGPTCCVRRRARPSRRQ